MTIQELLGVPVQPAICYSGYRQGQSPRTAVYPTYDQIKQDLLILAPHWKLLRLYDCSRHAELVLDVIRNEKLDLKVMLGVDWSPEVSNPNCPWGGKYPEAELANNRKRNDRQFARLIELANQYPDIVFCLSAGNEATVDWTDHLVPVERVIEAVQHVKKHARQPMTFCENYVPWAGKIRPLADVLDFISIHSYPVWENKPIEEALAYTQANYDGVARLYPGKPVVITEAGWPTASNGRGIPPARANEDLQAAYHDQLTQWARSRGILTFLFEAFDEPWKGSDDPNEPEKHWGLFYVDRMPKKAVRALTTERPAARLRSGAV